MSVWPVYTVFCKSVVKKIRKYSRLYDFYILKAKSCTQDHNAKETTYLSGYLFSYIGYCLCSAQEAKCKVYCPLH